MKTKKILPILGSILALMSCAKEELSNDIVSPDLETASTNEIRVCVDKKVTIEKNYSKSEKALLKDKLWSNGKTLRVKFMDNNASESLKDRVMEKARIWEKYANIKFDVVTSGDADIRITFDNSQGSWSALGLHSNYLSQWEASMNYGWLYDHSSDLDIQKVVLHEFGHALGAIHEHQHPEHDIIWNEDVVIETYLKKGWTEERINYNILTQYDANATLHSEYDKYSIMHYSFGFKLTESDSFVYNTELSAMDKEFIGKIYPFDEDQDETSGIPIGKKISIYSNAHSRYIFNSGDSDDEGIIEANTSNSGAEFIVEDAGNGLIALKSITNGLYVCSDLKLGENGPLVANRTKVGGAWEKFEWITNDDGTISLLAQSTKMYVCADKKISDSAPLVANRTAVGAWEKFAWREK